MSVQGTSGLGIAAVERDTGLTKDILRMWERRYGFPAPARDQFGERAYTLTEVAKLRAVRRLMDLGHRPGKIIALSLEELDALAAGANDHPACPEELLPLIDLIRAHRVEDLRLHLSQALMRQGLRSFLLDTIEPLNGAVGEAWARGELQIFEEHLYTEALQVILRGALNASQHTGAPPRVLLTTLPGEQHGLGLLMAEAMLAIEDCACVSLGTQTPLHDIALAAGSQQADVVALSFSAAYPAAQVWPGLRDLRQRLPPNLSLWAGGGNPALSRRAEADVTVIGSLEALPHSVAALRASLSARAEPGQAFSEAK